MIHGVRYQCAEGCNTFITVGQPTYCPHCGGSEVEPHEPVTVTYWRAEEHYENDA